MAIMQKRSTDVEKKKDAVSLADKGAKRKWLRAFETLPPQLLNAYGEHRLQKMSDKEVWDHMSTPLKSGAEYMTEVCSSEDERRGIGLNRWLYAMAEFCKYQQKEEVKKQNQAPGGSSVAVGWAWAQLVSRNGV